MVAKKTMTTITVLALSLGFSACLGVLCLSSCASGSAGSGGSEDMVKASEVVDMQGVYDASLGLYRNDFFGFEINVPKELPVHPVSRDDGADNNEELIELLKSSDTNTMDVFDAGEAMSYSIYVYVMYRNDSNATAIAEWENKETIKAAEQAGVKEYSNGLTTVQFGDGSTHAGCFHESGPVNTNQPSRYSISSILDERDFYCTVEITCPYSDKSWADSVLSDMSCSD